MNVLQEEMRSHLESCLSSIKCQLYELGITLSGESNLEERERTLIAEYERMKSRLRLKWTDNGDNADGEDDGENEMIELAGNEVEQEGDENGLFYDVSIINDASLIAQLRSESDGINTVVKTIKTKGKCEYVSNSGPRVWYSV